MDQISNLVTLPNYDPTLTLGPDDYEGVSADVWNQSVVMQVYDKPNGKWQQGGWGAEILVAPSSVVLQRCAGVRFKTNPAAGATAGRVVASAWRQGEVLVTGGVQLLGTLSATGTVSPSVKVNQVSVMETADLSLTTAATVVTGMSSSFTIAGGAATYAFAGSIGLVVDTAGTGLLTLTATLDGVDRGITAFLVDIGTNGLGASIPFAVAQSVPAGAHTFSILAKKGLNAGAGRATLGEGVLTIVDQ